MSVRRPNPTGRLVTDPKPRPGRRLEVVLRAGQQTGAGLSAEQEQQWLLVEEAVLVFRRLTKLDRAVWDSWPSETKAQFKEHITKSWQLFEPELDGGKEKWAGEETLQLRAQLYEWKSLGLKPLLVGLLNNKDTHKWLSWSPQQQSAKIDEWKQDWVKNVAYRWSRLHEDVQESWIRHGIGHEQLLHLLDPWSQNWARDRAKFLDEKERQEEEDRWVYDYASGRRMPAIPGF